MGSWFMSHLRMSVVAGSLTFSMMGMHSAASHAVIDDMCLGSNQICAWPIAERVTLELMRFIIAQIPRSSLNQIVRTTGAAQPADTDEPGFNFTSQIVGLYSGLVDCPSRGCALTQIDRRSFAVKVGIARSAGWATVIDPSAVALAIGFFAIMVLLFGFDPTHHASRSDPMGALKAG